MGHQTVEEVHICGHISHWGLLCMVIVADSCAVLQAERMTQSEVANLIRTAVYIVVSIPIPAGAAAAVFFLPHSRYSIVSR